MDSQAIFQTVEILETKPLNELVSETVIKVCYVSEMPNPNETVINKETGRQIAATLPGAPIVGLFDKSTNDFVEHSRKVVIEKDSVKLEDLTRPYGFVSPIDKPWYQDFIEEGVTRTYLLCKGFLWTRQYAEANLIKGKGQSMELNEDDLKGYYENRYFIISNATLDKLCILGDRYKPCFSGAQFMTTYASLYNKFADDIETVIGRRYYVLNDRLQEKPVSTNFAMENNITEPVVEPIQEPIVDPTVVSATEEPVAEPAVEPAAEQAAEPTVEPTVEPTPEPAAEPAVEYTQEPTADPVVDTESVEPAASVEPAEPVAEPVVQTEPAIDYAAINADLNSRIDTLKAQIADKDATIEQLKSEISVYKLKEQEENSVKKEELITSYKSMLSEDEINNIVGASDNLTIDELESKLAVTYTRKQRAAEPAKPSVQVDINTVSVDNTLDMLPDYIKRALEYDRVHGY